MSTEPREEAPVGWLLRRARKERGYSQEELAERAGVGRRAIADAERGARVPHGSTLRKIAAAMDLSVEELMRMPPPAEIPEDVSGWALSPSTATFRRHLRDAPTETIRLALLPFLSGHLGAAKAIGDRKAYERARERWYLASTEWLARVGPLEVRDPPRRRRGRSRGDGEAVPREETA